MDVRNKLMAAMQNNIFNAKKIPKLFPALQQSESILIVVENKHEKLPQFKETKTSIDANKVNIRDAVAVGSNKICQAV